MDRILKLSIFVFAVVIFIAFFLPWVSVESQVAGKVSKFFSGEEQASLKKISGYEVPILANGKDAKLMISIIKIFNPSVTDADKKSWLIWGVPGLAVVIFLVVMFFGKNKWVNLGLGVLGIAIFAFATFKIKTTNLDKVVLNVNISPGLWIILWMYLGIGLMNLSAFSKLYFKVKR